MIKAILIDDEQDAIDGLAILLKNHCPEVEIVATAMNALEASKEINQKKPDLIFLDIEMPVTNGLQFLEQLPKPLDFDVIFVTAYDKYAIQAMNLKNNLSAMRYLLKPIDKDILIELVNEFKNREVKNLTTEQLQLIIKNNLNISDAMIPVSNIKGFDMVKIKDIMYLEADDKYTNIYIDKSKPINAVSKTLKEYEKILDEKYFIRCHRKYLVNKSFIKRYLHEDDGRLILNDETKIEVGETYKKSVLAFLKNN